MRESVNLSSWPCQEKWAFWIVLLFCLEEYRHDCIFWATASSCFGFCFLALSKSCSISLPDPVLKLLQVVFTLNLIYLILLLHCRSFITFYDLALNRSMFAPTCTSVSPVDSCLPRHLGSNAWEVSDKNRKLCFILFLHPFVFNKGSLKRITLWPRTRVGYRLNFIDSDYDSAYRFLVSIPIR